MDVYPVDQTRRGFFQLLGVLTVLTSVYWVPELLRPEDQEASPFAVFEVRPSPFSSRLLSRVMRIDPLVPVPGAAWAHA